MKWLLTRMKKLFKKKWLWVLIIVIIIAVAYFLTRPEKAVEYVTVKVEKGTLTQTVSETGAIQSAREIDLNFKGNGTITEINVEEGAQVEAGDVLARLDAGDAEIQVRQAQAGLDIARANLNKFLAGASDEDIKVTQETVDNALIAYENAKRDHEALLTKLDSDLDTYEENVIDTKNNLVLSMESAVTLMDHSFEIVEDIEEDRLLQPYFSVTDPQAKNNFYREYDYFDLEINKAKQSFNQSKNTKEDTDVKAAYNEVTRVLEEMRQLLDLLFTCLDASISSGSVPQSTLNSYISSVKMEQNTTNNSIANLNNAKQAYDNAKINLSTALANKDLNIANSESAVDSALGQYELAKAQLDLKKAKPRDVDVAYYQAQVNQAQAAVDLALSTLSDYIIYAPTDGQVVFVNYDVGEQIGIGLTTVETKPVITILGEHDFEIEVDVPESDIVKLSVGNPAEITLDAYGEDVIFTGQLVFIDLAETNIQDVVYYKVMVELEKTDKAIKPGMTANVDILTAEKKDALYVPIRAVKENEQGGKYVEILENGQAEKVIVKTGMRGDQGIEITSGLSEGQEVITYVRE